MWDGDGGSVVVQKSTSEDVLTVVASGIVLRGTLRAPGCGLWGLGVLQPRCLAAAGRLVMCSNSVHGDSTTFRGPVCLQQQQQQVSVLAALLPSVFVLPERILAALWISLVGTALILRTNT